MKVCSRKNHREIEMKLCLIISFTLFYFSRSRTRPGSTEIIPLSIRYKMIQPGICIHLVGGGILTWGEVMSVPGEGAAALQF